MGASDAASRRSSGGHARPHAAASTVRVAHYNTRARMGVHTLVRAQSRPRAHTCMHVHRSAMTLSGVCCTAPEVVHTCP